MTPRGLVCSMTSLHTDQSEGLGGTRPSCGMGVSSTSSGTQWGTINPSEQSDKLKLVLEID